MKKKRAIVKVETKLAKKPDAQLAKAKRTQLTLVQSNKRNLAHAEELRDRALKALQEAVLTYSAAEAACAGAYLELLSAGNALGNKQ